MDIKKSQLNAKAILAELEWLHKVIQLLTGKMDMTKMDMTKIEQTKVEPEKTESVLSKASIEKLPKRFRTTKRNQHEIMIKKPLAKTRRALKLHGLKI